MFYTMCIRYLSLSWLWWLRFRPSQFKVVPELPQKVKTLKAFKKCNKNSHLATYSKVLSKSLIHSVEKKWWNLRSVKIDLVIHLARYIRHHDPQKQRKYTNFDFHLLREIERESWCQFHQHFTSSFNAQRSQKSKKTVKSSSFFVLLGSECVKAARKYVDEIDSWLCSFVWNVLIEFVTKLIWSTNLLNWINMLVTCERTVNKNFNNFELEIVKKRPKRAFIMVLKQNQWNKKIDNEDDTYIQVSIIHADFPLSVSAIFYCIV